MPSPASDPAAFLLSIVTVAFNDRARLAATIESVAAAAHGPAGLVEYLVVDGGSTDGTAELLAAARREGRVDRWISEPDRGIYHAMNKGLAMAAGRYLYFLNAGDALEPGALEKVLSAMETGRPPLVLAKVELAGGPPGSGSVYGRRPAGPADFERGMPVCHQGVFYRRDAVAGGYDTAYRNLADRKLTFEVLERFGFDSALFLDVAVARYAGGNLAERRFGLYAADELRWALWFPGGPLNKARRLARLAASLAIKLAKRSLKRTIGPKLYDRLKHRV